jgi:hypothetical protein
MLVLGGLGPVLLLLVMATIGWKALDTSVHESRAAVLNRALEGDHFAARFVAEQFALDIDKRWRILEYSANDTSLHELMDQLDVLPAGDDARRPLQQKLEEWIAAQHTRFNLQFRPGTQSRGWFLLDRRGNQVARSPHSDTTINKNYAHRDYFHGLGYDVAPDSPEAAKMRPLGQPFRSHIFRSRVTGNLMVALSVPVRTKKHGDKPVGVLCMAVESGAFADFLGTSRQFAVLVDTRPDAVNKKPGLIVEHHYFDEHPSDAGKREYYVDAEVIERLRRLEKQRLDEWRRAAAGETSPAPDPAPQGADDFLGNYVDPVMPATDDNRWLAVVEPVIVVRPQKGLMETGWGVLVQERYDQAVAPVNTLHRDLIRLGLGGLAAVAVVVALLWGFVILVLNDSTRERLTRFLRRRAGLATERSIASATPGTPKDSATAEWVRQTDKLE